MQIRPIARVPGSQGFMFVWSMSMEGKRLFRQYDKFNSDTFLDFLKIIHHKFPKCYLFMDMASPQYRSWKMNEYLEQNYDTPIPVCLPTPSPEFMVSEEVWNIAKQDLLVLKHFPSFEDFKQKISCYFRTKRFGLNMRN